MCNSVVGDPTPIPTRLELITRSFLLKAPATMRLSLNTSKIGNPEIVLTDIKLPLNSSVTLNKLPDPPATLNTFEPVAELDISSLAIGTVVPIPILLPFSKIGVVVFPIVVALVNFVIVFVVPLTATLVPEVPAVPEVPDEPLVPDEPDVPLVPAVPDEPDEPDEPDVPLDPDEPAVPEVPDEPAVPDVPLDPEDPEVPDDPLLPDVPEEPDVPDEPAVPEVPDEPLDPDEPAVPDEPDVPDVPLDPDEPAVPEVPAVPLDPDEPDEPELPDVPLEPLVPDEPEDPAVPLVPAVPDVPLDPDEPLVPEVPELPDEPAVPDVPDVPPNAIDERDLTFPRTSVTKMFVSVVPVGALTRRLEKTSKLPVVLPLIDIMGPVEESNRTAPLEDTDRVTFESFEPLN